MNTRILSPFSGKPVAIFAMLCFLCHACSQPQHSAVVQNPVDKEEGVARLIQYEVKPEHQAAFRKVLNDYVLHALEQDGNILSEAYYEQENPSVMWLIERWHSKQELETTGKHPSFQAVETLSSQALTGPGKVIYVQDLEPLSKQQWRSIAKQNDHPITIMLFVDCKPGTEDSFKNIYHTAMPQFRSEPGVINYQISRLENDSTQFVTYEKFRDEAAFQYHLNFPPIQPVIAYLETGIKKQPFQSGLHRLIAFAP